MGTKYTIGVDFGTDSVRALLINSSDGEVLANGHSEYPRWSKKLYCDADQNRFRQHPLDYVESLEVVFKQITDTVAPSILAKIEAISIATTGSTPVAVNHEGTPLALTKEFMHNPNAMFILWKDHSAIKEAAEINLVAQSKSTINFTKYSGGEYSSEWFWAKILHVLRNDDSIRKAAYSWVEHCDWITALLIGNTTPESLKRSRCAAGHKAMWHEEWGGLPPDDFWAEIDPLLKGIRKRLYSDTFTSDNTAGEISASWARKLGLPENILIGVGTLDAHMGAIGGQIQPNQLVKVIGTSTCDMMVVSESTLQNRIVHGISGQVKGSILPNMIGLEAGQSAFGDIYAWFREVLFNTTANIIQKSTALNESDKSAILKEILDSLISDLSEEAAKIPIDINGTLAIDWMNGRRTPYSNQSLKGGIIGINLSTSAPNIFKSLVEATAFGSKKIMLRLQEEGVQIDSVIAVGGVAQKSDFIMQTLSDVLDCPISVAKAVQTCALGAAMAAAVVAKIHPDFKTAQKLMGGGFQKTFKPIPQNAKKYQHLYERYNAFAKFIENSDSQI